MIQYILPTGWSPPVAPDDWEAPAVDLAHGEVDYGDVEPWQLE
jgi:hypothetical protein